MAKPWKGSLTAEQAAERAGMTPRQLVDIAVLGGVPKGFGPFGSIKGSDYRILIDEDDFTRWNDAGRPLGKSYRA